MGVHAERWRMMGKDNIKFTGCFNVEGKPEEKPRKRKEPFKLERGRPKKPAALRRSDLVHARVTPSEREMIIEMAKNAGMSQSQFVVAACFSMGGVSPMRAREINAKRIWRENNPDKDTKKKKGRKNV